MAKRHTDLTDGQKQILEGLYRNSPRSVDDLPYTKDMKTIHAEFRKETNLRVTIRDVYKALKNMGRAARLGGKLRTSRQNPAAPN